MNPGKLILLLALAVLPISAVAAGTDDVSAARQTIVAYYAAWAAHDVARYRSLCTDDYLILDNGKISDLEQDVAYLRTHPEAWRGRTDHFDFRRVVVQGDAAYVIYFLNSVIRNGQAIEHRRYLESAVLRRSAHGWQVFLLHSTRLAAASKSQPHSVWQQIQPMLNEMLHLANAHDTDRFMTFYLHRPSLIYVNDGIVIYGWDNLRAQQLKWWKNGKSDVIYRANGATEFTVLASGVVMVTEPRASTRTGTDGKPSRNDFVVSEIWKKLPEGWRIVYGHESRLRWLPAVCAWWNSGVRARHYEVRKQT